MLEQSAERGDASLPPPLPPRLSSRVAPQTIQPVAPAPGDMKCFKHIFQFGSMGPKGLFADTSWLIPWKEAEVPMFQ